MFAIPTDCRQLTFRILLVIISTAPFQVALGDPLAPPTPTREEHVTPAAETSTDGRIVGEFEHQAALILGVNELVQYHPDTLREIVAAIHDRIKLIGVVKDDQQRDKTISLLEAHNLPRSNIDFFRWPAEAMWVRDYAPLFLSGKKTTAVDFAYAEPNRDMEGALGIAFAATFHLPYDHCRLTLEGGNLLSNGRGLCCTTTKLAEQNTPRGYKEQDIGALLHERLHFDRWIRLEPLNGEPTGHVESFMTLCAVNKAIVGRYRAEDDAENAKILDENAQILKGQQTADGPLEIIRIPMPSHKDGNWRTYTSVIYANGVVLVPQYRDANSDLDKTALRVYRETMPKWKVIGIDCSKLIAKRGALHSLSKNVPAFADQK